MSQQQSLIVQQFYKIMTRRWIEAFRVELFRKNKKWLRIFFKIPEILYIYQALENIRAYLETVLFASIPKGTFQELERMQFSTFQP